MRHLDPDVPTASRSHAFIERSVDWLIDALDLHVGSSVLDLECGPGLYATRLARHGIEVLGVDVARRSIKYANDVAKQESLPIRQQLGS